jgi:hypothetical protein
MAPKHDYLQTRFCQKGHSMEDMNYSFFTTLMAEYAALKNEQAQRIVLRDTCLYIAISANTAIAAVVTQQQNHPLQLLLFIPAASTLLFWLYATNDSMVTQIRKYITNNIIPKLSPLEEKYKANLLGWEYLRRRRTLNRIVSKLFRLFAIWFTFSGASIAALWANAPNMHDVSQSWVWLTAATFALLPYIFGLWLLDI